MTIRAKLALSISLLLGVAAGVVGWGVLLVSASFSERDAGRRITVIVNSVERAAQDALLQKDDLLLISYINFLRAQYPSLAYARIEWDAAGKRRHLSVGQPLGGKVDERMMQINDPSDPTRRVSVSVGVDKDVLMGMVAADLRRLSKILGVVIALTMLVGVLFSVWFARSLTRPLEALVGLAGEIGSGRLGARLEWKSDDELGQLVGVFNLMSQRLEELDEAKKNFVSSVTHELRSPLGAIESFLHLIRGKMKLSANGDAAQCEEYLGRIQANVQRLGGFINDLLDVAKIEKGKMECVLRPMRLDHVASEVCQFFEAKAQQQGVVLESQLGSPSAVQGDPERLRQVLVNLVANALKFTPRGGRITLGAEQFRLESGEKWLEISVSDTGRGMEESDRQRLFAAFSQGSNVREGVTGTKGTGLGLYITKSIVEQHGGRIEVKSSPGQGTSIQFTVKVAA